MKKKNQKQYLVPTVLCLLVICGAIYYYLFSSLSNKKETTYICIDDDDDIDSVTTKLSVIANKQPLFAYSTLARHSNYAENIRTGRYAVKPGDGALKIFRHMKNGLQTPVSLTIPSVRTIDRLSVEIGKRLMLDSIDLYNTLTDPAVCQKYGYDTATIVCMFIPNTYDIYWNVSMENFLDRMKRECNNFWNINRQGKAKQMGLSPVQVTTLASIIDEETANNEEKPMIAGMYLNRLKQNMPLQADPTIKFALKRFELRRIYNSLLNTDSPYNTYKYPGLPPGPIRIPTVAGIDAVLNHVEHDYLYMCAKEDFSGTHNFARTYQEHLQNAERYSKALNERGIK
ncbi:MAG: endolytic transglycosylase MltG [Prevotella sp.]|nr:endolytic transglycosylase MltG [Prevotella sp.]